MDIGFGNEVRFWRASFRLIPFLVLSPDQTLVKESKKRPGNGQS